MSSGLFATPTPTPIGIPQADGSGFIDTGWLHASITPTPDHLVLSDGSGYIDPDWLRRGNFSSPNIFQQTDGTGAVLGTGIALTLSNQAAALVWAGPVSGAAAAPTFRALTTTDIPSLSGIYQPLNTKLTSISALANAVGWLHNDGAGNFVYSTPPGGVGANPTALLGLTAVNGVATTFLRSDGAPALDQSISPTWSGNHVFQNLVTEKAAAINGTAGGGFLTLVGQSANPTSPTAGTLLLHSSTKNGYTRMEQDNEAATNLVYGRDNVFLGKNETGVTLTKGTVVFTSGTVSGSPQISKARANAGATMPALGVVMDDIPHLSFGQVMTQGILSFDTTVFSDGDAAWVSPTTAGLLTRTRPVGPTNLVQRMGTILVSGVAGVGLMLVNTVGYAPVANDIGLGAVENTALSTWAGSANLTTLGTIAAGTWHGTAIADAYIASAATWNAKMPAFTLGNSLKFTGSVLDTIQDIRTTATPGFLGLNIGGGTLGINGSIVFSGRTGTLIADSVGNVNARVPLVTDGGTGLSTIASGKMLYASALNTFAALSTGNSLAITGGVLDTIQDIRTSASPQFSAIGIGQAVNPSYVLAATGPTLYNGNVNIEGGNVFISSSVAGLALDVQGTISSNALIVNPTATGAKHGLSMAFDANLEVSWIQSIRNNVTELRALVLNPLGGNVLIGKNTGASVLSIARLPTSSAGLGSGDVWVDTTGGLNILKIV